MRKRHKEKRSHLAPFAASRVSVPRRANPEIIKEYHGRVQSVTGPKHDVSPISANTFTSPVPQTRGLVEPSKDYSVSYNKAGDPVHIQDPPPRSIIAELKKRLAEDEGVAIERLHNLYQGEDRPDDRGDGWRRQGIDDFNYIVWVRTAKFTVKLFFSGAKWVWVWEETTFAKRSIVYPSKEKAEFAFNTKTITWIEVYS
jgi:hypothetical protein